MPLKFFITGTDTNVGKTYVSTVLLRSFNARGLQTIGLKPIASGAILRQGQLYSEDALALQEAASCSLPLDLINPITLAPPIAPHIAAEKIGLSLSVMCLLKNTLPAFNYAADLYLIEGAGGWYVPLNSKETLADFAKALRCPVILVVGMRLGCINHTLLTVKAMQEEGVPIAGWIANMLDKELLAPEENLNTLRQQLAINYLGVINHQQKDADLIVNQLIQNALIDTSPDENALSLPSASATNKCP